MSRCHACGTENPQGMNFCQNCGTKLAAAAPPPAAPQANPPAAAPPPAYGYGGRPPGYGAPAQGYGTPPPQGYGAPTPGYDSHPRPMPAPADLVQSRPTPVSAPTRPCPNCGAQTPDGFAFCQQCGSKLQGSTPPAPERSPAITSGETSSRSGQIGGASGYGGVVDEAHAATLAAPGSANLAPMTGRGHDAAPAAPAPAPRTTPAPAPAAGVQPAWGRLVSVNRDGTDGRAHALAGEWAVVGRQGADIDFPEDRFLARAHARIEQRAGGARVVPLDTLNGVFRRVDAPVTLSDGAVLLLGREVLRLELVGEAERAATPLVRHGVALFGSPPREPWGRLVQLLPSGGQRDVRYLDNREITIGREEGDLIFRDDAFLSRVHAVLRWDGSRCTLEDMNSSNGTFVRISGPTEVAAGDHVRMGDQLFRLELG